jgi:hypothetical protein
MADTATQPPVNRTVELRFRWKYILLPVAVFFIAVILVAVFYWQLTPDVAYRFNSDGSSRSELSRQMVTLIMLLPQVLLVLLAAAVVWGTARLSRLLWQTVTPPKLEGVVLLIGNMAALPQIVLGFIMVDIFSYNVYGSHLMPVWLFVLVVMLVGGVVLTIFFIQALLRSRGNSGINHKE